MQRIVKLLDFRLLLFTLNCYLMPDEIRKIETGRPDCHILNQAFHYTRRITPNRVTSLRCPTPRHIAKATQLPAYMLKRWRTVCNAV